jgi:hypothetical protein
LPAELAAVEAAPGAVAVLVGGREILDADDAFEGPGGRRVARLVARRLEDEEVLGLERLALERDAAFPLVVQGRSSPSTFFDTLDRQSSWSRMSCDVSAQRRSRGGTGNGMDMVSSFRRRYAPQ